MLMLLMLMLIPRMLMIAQMRMVLLPRMLMVVGMLMMSIPRMLIIIIFLGVLLLMVLLSWILQDIYGIPDMAAAMDAFLRSSAVAFVIYLSLNIVVRKEYGSCIDCGGSFHRTKRTPRRQRM